MQKYSREYKPYSREHKPSIVKKRFTHVSTLSKQQAIQKFTNRKS